MRRLLSVGDLIVRTIDFQLSKESGRTEIMQGVSEYLDGLRKEFAEVCEMLPDLKDAVI